LLTLTQIPSEENLRAKLSEDAFFRRDILTFSEHDPALVKNFDHDRIVDAWEQLKHGFQQLADVGAWIPGPLLATFTLSKSNKSRLFGKAERLDVALEGENPAAAILIRAIRVVEDEGARLARCDAAECQKIFIKRKRGMFCSTKCMEREKKRVWRERHPPKAAEEGSE
jgi:hypothetical protein